MITKKNIQWFAFIITLVAQILRIKTKIGAIIMIVIAIILVIYSFSVNKKDK